ncbi:MAG: hypothetical protein WC602_06855 [archaeon]
MAKVQWLELNVKAAAITGAVIGFLCGLFNGFAYGGIAGYGYGMMGYGYGMMSGYGYGFGALGSAVFGIIAGAIVFGAIAWVYNYALKNWCA